MSKLITEVNNCLSCDHFDVTKNDFRCRLLKVVIPFHFDIETDRLAECPLEKFEYICN